MRFFYILLLMRVATSVSPDGNYRYDPGELLTKIFKPNVNITSRQRDHGLIFEDDHQNQGQYNLITFEENNHRLQFQNDNEPLYENLHVKPDAPLKFEDQLPNDQVTFQDDNRIDQSNKKRKRRRRKPKNGFGPGIPSNLQGGLNYQGFDGRPVVLVGPGPYPGDQPFGPNQGYPGSVPFRRRRRPRPSLASTALSSITGALTSIALYDDYQCVPRLLCEAAGGGSLGGGGVLDSVAGIQPLLTLLSAYSGVSSSPLFVFGRAVFLGMTSKGNTGTCRYAYPQCPTDPEQMVHYLNNHNGGFFRFFNAPGDSSLEQFYNHLGQGQFVQNGQYSDQGSYPYGQNEGYQQGYQYDQNQPGYGLYQNTQNPGYGLQNNQYGRPDEYAQNYGSNYGYNTYGFNNIRYKDTSDKIEKRIQNKPLKDDGSDNFDAKWQFPDNNVDDKVYESDDNDEVLRFSDASNDKVDNDSTRKGKSILFPENYYHNNAYSNKHLNLRIINNNRATKKPYFNQNYYSYNQIQNVANTESYKQTTITPINNNDYYYDYKHKFYVKKNNNNNYYYKEQNQNYYSNKNYDNNRRPENFVNYNINYAENDRLQTVYVVRGNGDPNRPEIVKVRPGQVVNK